MILFISPNFGQRENIKNLISAAREQNIKTEICFLKFNKNLITNDEFCAVYGEEAFCEWVAEECNLNLHQNSLDWIAKVAHPFVKRKINFLTLQEAKKEQKLNNSILNKKRIDPADDKCFKGGVLDAFPNVSDSTPILLSDNVDWKFKFRYIIKEGKVVTRCCYQIDKLFNNKTTSQTNIKVAGIDNNSFMQTILTHINCAPSCVIDIGVNKETNMWGIIKTKPIWASDFLGCDPQFFLDALIHSCRKIN